MYNNRGYAWQGQVAGQNTVVMRRSYVRNLPSNGSNERSTRLRLYLTNLTAIFHKMEGKV